ncbi:hypothetical protein TNCV_1406291 [Trichonephila clavipes]|nr:hypothetical protein TNCV_1406291 [Trichonephila clavipes]
MKALQPTPTSVHSNSSMFVPTNLKSCSHVFLKVDSVQPPLSQNYTGPHEEDTDDIPIAGISKQRTDETDPHLKDKTMSHVNKTESQPNEKTVNKTRSEVHVRFPKDLEQYIT